MTGVMNEHYVNPKDVRIRELEAQLAQSDKELSVIKIKYKKLCIDHSNQDTLLAAQKEYIEFLGEEYNDAIGFQIARNPQSKVVSQEKVDKGQTLRDKITKLSKGD